MASIKINYKAGDKRTSTTFSEFTAQFFLQAWHSMQSLKEENATTWTITSPNDMFYRSIDEVKREFQEAVNQMIDYYDMIYAEQGANLNDAWTREEIEYHLLMNIYEAGNGVYLKYD